MAEIQSVSQVNNYIKDMMEQDGFLSGLMIRGELSNYKTYPSGHHYFSLKDEGSTLRCVLFRREASKLRFKPTHGMKVIVSGRISAFPRDGQYQLYAQTMQPDGVGDLHVAFEQLKDKLFQEGLFDPAHKKPLPPFPNRIALITSSAGAAVRDMIRILKTRWPLAQVILLPVRVQGVEAPGEIATAIRYASRHQVADVIITGRGGGSLEDLWAFNEEQVARAIYQCQVPIISAVGHEPDVTIADFVADVRASTPSNGAELATPDSFQLQLSLDQYGSRLEQSITRQLEQAKQQMHRLSQSRAIRDPHYYVQEKRMVLDYQSRRLSQGLNQVLAQEQTRFSRLAASLDALSPLKVLSRGYAFTTKEEGQVVTSIKDLSPGESLTIRLADGSVNCLVKDIQKLTKRKSTSKRGSDYG